MRRLRTQLRTATVGSSQFPAGWEPTLIIDFVPPTGVQGYTLDMEFAGESPGLIVYEPDPTVQSGITNIQVWN